MKQAILIPILLTTLLATSSTKAGTQTTEPAPLSPTPTVTSTVGDWEFTLGLYGWGAGLNGDLGVNGIVTPIDISFSEILDSLDMVAMGMVEARKGRWIFQLEGFYLRNSVTNLSVPPGGGIREVSLIAKTTRLEPVIGYRVLDNGCTSIDLLAGASYYNISNELQILQRPAFASAKDSEDWIDPIVGIRVSHSVSDRWILQARGDIGGFGVNSDLVWQAFGMVGYQLSDSSLLFAGYRHAAVDYENGGFVYDAASSGPLIGLTVNW